MRAITILIMILTSSSAIAQYPFGNGTFQEIEYENKGHFYLENHKDRDILITPEGRGFYPIGINHLNVLFDQNISLTQSDAETKNSLISHMKNWGFNCGGYGTANKLINEGIYFIANFNLVKHGFYHLNNVEFPDVFDISFDKHVEAVVKQAANSYYKPHQLIGVVWSDLPSWNIYKSRMLRQTDWVTEIRNMDKNSPGKKAYIDFLKERYKNRTDNLKKYYELSDEDIINLEDYDFSVLYLGHPMIMADDELFMVEIAKRYYKVGAKYHDIYFPNTLLFGDRFLYGDHPKGVLQVAAEYVDAISIQIGDGYGETMLPSFPYPKTTMNQIREITQKPVLIADHQISFYTNDYKSTIFSQAGDQSEASSETMKFLKAAYAEKYVIGYFRCTYLTKHEPNGRGIKQGLVDFEQKPYEEITKAYSSVNNSISKYIIKQP